MPTIVSAIQPTGSGMPHLGNYLGSLKRFADLGSSRDAYFFVADQHATTVDYRPDKLAESSIATAAALVACGVGTRTAAPFIQSSVRQHAEMALVLGHLATLGPLERMTQFKSKSRTADGMERDSIGLGLLTYPVLMAADILLYEADEVPVGEDQHQHLQFTQHIARRFNSRFRTDMLRTPRALISKDAARIMSLRDPTRKMSKSDPERRATVYIDDSIDEADRKFRSAVSESEPLPSDVDGLNGRPAAIALVDLLASLEERTRVDILAEIGGRGFSVLKSRLSEAFERRITPIGKDIHSLLGQDRDRLETMLDEGALRAEASAERMMVQVRAKVGFRPCIPPCRA